jgi:Polyketide cyclase / dehydrase and lipid transport
VYGHAPFRFVSTVGLTITPEQLFALLDDAESWPQWATVITKVTWTSRNRTASAPRTVDMRGGIVGDVGALPLASWGYPTRLRGRISGLGTAQPHGFSVQPSR